MIETVYELTMYPNGHSFYSVGVTDMNGRLWQFWGSPSFASIAIDESVTDDIDFRRRTSHVSILLMSRGIDPKTVTRATVRRLAREWVKDRNADIKNGNITD